MCVGVWTLRPSKGHDSDRDTLRAGDPSSHFSKFDSFFLRFVNLDMADSVTSGRFCNMTFALGLLKRIAYTNVNGAAASDCEPG